MEEANLNDSTTNSYTKSSNDNGSGPQQRSENRAVWIGRFAFLAFLSAVAVVMGFVAFFILKKQETSLAEKQFIAVADRALNSAVQITKRKRLGGVSLASVASFAAPDAAEWPFVTIPGFSNIAQNLIDTSSGDDTGFVPFVAPDQLKEFEGFAYDYYLRNRQPPFPEGTGISSFGRGIWGPDIENKTGSPDGRYRVVNGSTPYPSENDIIAPILHHSLGAHPLLMVNTRYEPRRGGAIDNMIACAKKRISLDNMDDENCNVLTDVHYVPLGHFGSTLRGPLSIVMHPVFPANDKSQLTGFIGSSIVWEDVLLNGFNNKVQGVDCVLKTGDQYFTYSVANGEPSFRAEGDDHDSKYDRYSRSIQLTDSGLFTNTSATFTLTLYPTEAFFDTFSTNNPMIASMGAICCLLLTSIIFILYDSLVRKEFNAKRELLQAKRKFMRFVSHEVRTPLNATCTGLTLLREEMEAYLQHHFASSEAPLASETRMSHKGAMSDWLQLAEDIHSSALSSVDVLNDLLNYDKIEMGTLSLERTVWSAWEVVQQTAAEFNLAAKTKRINFNLECCPEPDDRRAVADQVRITQCIRNMVSNALKFTPVGGNISIGLVWKSGVPEKKDDQFKLVGGGVTSCRQDGWLEVSVADSGAGMTADQVAQLFRAGVQFNVNKLQAGQGSGLGLFITKGIVEQHGGRLTVVSEGLNKGATFTMTLPLYFIHDTASESTAGNKCVPGGTAFASEDVALALKPTTMETAEVSPLRILVVDDALSNRKLLSRLLSNRGHICDQAENGQIALDMALKAMNDSKPYHSILMDYEMPEMDGPTSASKMREAGCDSFIVGITGNLLAEDVQYFKRCGANGVLGKPVVLSDLQLMWMEYGVVGQSKNDVP